MLNSHTPLRRSQRALSTPTWLLPLDAVNGSVARSVSSRHLSKARSRRRSSSTGDRVLVPARPQSPRLMSLLNDPKTRQRWTCSTL
jgi:hypothetical protein